MMPDVHACDAVHAPSFIFTASPHLPFCVAVFLLIALFHPVVADAQPLYLQTGRSVRPFPKAGTWHAGATKDVLVRLQCRKCAVKPTAILLGQRQPHGVNIVALFGDYAFDLPVDFGEEADGFDDHGDLKPDWRVQAAVHDFDGDGVPEVLIAVGDGLVTLTVHVFAYDDPGSEKDLFQNSNWRLIGRIWGQEKAIVRGRSIEVPIGSQGLFERHEYRDGRFVEIGD